MQDHVMRACFARRQGFKLVSVLIVDNEALPILESLSTSPVHLVAAPATLIDLAVIRLEDTLTLSDAFLMLALVLVTAKVEGDADSITGSLIEHALVAEAIFEKHIADSMHLALSVDLSVIDIAVVHALHSLNSLNYAEGYYWLNLSLHLDLRSGLRFSSRAVLYSFERPTESISFRAKLSLSLSLTNFSFNLSGS